MRQLLLIKEKIKKFVGKNEVFIIPVLKFLLTFMALTKINGALGQMKILTNSAITLIVALAGSFLPVNLTLVILAGISLAHVYAISFEAAILVAALFLVLFLLYFRFAAKDSVAVILVPLSFIYKVPYVMPVAMGLVGTPSSMVSTACGVIVYHVLHYISVNASALSAVATDEKDISAFKGLVDSILNNKTMLVLTIAFAATVLIVFFIRRLSISYCWFIAIAVGAIGDFLLIFFFNASLHGDVAIGGAFVGAIVSIILNLILQYFCFDLDYNRVEKVQFEDDEYYYYVKAVPKNTIKLSDNGRKKSKASKPTVYTEKPVRTDSGRTGALAGNASNRTVTSAGNASNNAASTGVNGTRTVSTGTGTTRAAARTGAAPMKNSDVEEINVTRVRETVRAKATREAQKSSPKAPFGLSGGRPAGEGRKKEKNGESD